MPTDHTPPATMAIRNSSIHLMVPQPIHHNRPVETTTNVDHPRNSPKVKLRMGSTYAVPSYDGRLRACHDHFEQRPRLHGVVGACRAPNGPLRTVIARFGAPDAPIGHRADHRWPEWSWDAHDGRRPVQSLMICSASARSTRSRAGPRSS